MIVLDSFKSKNKDKVLEKFKFHQNYPSFRTMLLIILKIISNIALKIISIYYYQLFDKIMFLSHTN